MPWGTEREHKVNLRFTARAMEHISDLMRKSDLEQPILGISFGRWHDEKRFHWMIEFYDRAKLSSDWPGWLGVTPTLEFLCIHPSILKELDGAILDVGDSGLITEGTA
jgi:hypothetical protein